MAHVQTANSSSTGGRRSLEVLILAARSLDPQNRVRRRVELSVVTPEDPDGEILGGATYTPWAQPHGYGQKQSVRWGKCGQKCSFTLSGGSGSADGGGSGNGLPPSEVDDFIQKSLLKVTLVASKLSVKNSLLREAKMMLPRDLIRTVTQELDEVTADVEAESFIPLRDLMAGAAKTISTGGWLRLFDPSIERTAASCCPAAADLWLQVYAMPDHKARIPELKRSLERVLASLDTSVGDLDGTPASNQQSEQDINEEEEEEGKQEQEQPKEAHEPKATEQSASKPLSSTKAPAAPAVSLLDLEMSSGGAAVAEASPVTGGGDASPPAPTPPAPADDAAFACFADFATHGAEAPTAQVDDLADCFKVPSPCPSDLGGAIAGNGHALNVAPPPAVPKLPVSTEQLPLGCSVEDAKRTNGLHKAGEPLVAPQAGIGMGACSNTNNSPLPQAGTHNGNSDRAVTIAATREVLDVSVPQDKVASVNGLEQQLLAGLSDSLRF